MSSILLVVEEVPFAEGEQGRFLLLLFPLCLPISNLEDLPNLSIYNIKVFSI